MATDYKKNLAEAKKAVASLPKSQQAAATKIINQAAKTGEGLSNNELAYFKANTGNIKADTNPVAFLGTLEQRQAFLANQQASAGAGAGAGGTGTTVTSPGQDAFEAAQAAERRSSYAMLADSFNTWGVPELNDIAKQYLQQGLSASEATLLLKESSVYKNRFKGNEGRLSRGLSAYNPAEYIQAEEAYANLLNANNLSGLATKDVFAKLISGAVSPAEVQDRINTVFNKIDNAPQDVKNELGRYFSQYGVGDANVQRNQVAEALLSGEDPAVKLQQGIKKAQLRAGATAAKYTLTSEEKVESIQKLLDEAGVSNTYAAGQAGFETLAQIEPSTMTLAERYKQEQVTQEELQKEAFLGLKSERRKKLQEQEQAAFKGTAGTTQVSLAGTTTAGAI